MQDIILTCCQDLRVNFCTLGIYETFLFQLYKTLYLQPRLMLVLSKILVKFIYFLTCD